MMNLGIERCSYNKTFFENGSITKARDESKNTFVEITVDDERQLAEVYYNKDFGNIEITKKIGYYDYINNLTIVNQAALIEKVEELING